MANPEYHVGCGFGGIYAGVLMPRNKTMWKFKSDVTEEAIAAVRDYMVQELLIDNVVSSGYEWTMKGGKKIELRVALK